MPARPPPSPCRPVPFARADSWSSRAVPPRCVSGEIAPSRDEAIGWREFLPAPAVVPPTPGRLARDSPKERHRRAREEPEPPERRRSSRRGRPPSTVSVRALAPSSAGFSWCTFSSALQEKSPGSRRGLRSRPMRPATRAKSVQPFPAESTSRARRGPVSDPPRPRRSLASPSSRLRPGDRGDHLQDRQARPR